MESGNETKELIANLADKFKFHLIELNYDEVLILLYSLTNMKNV